MRVEPFDCVATFDPCRRTPPFALIDSSLVCAEGSGIAEALLDPPAEGIVRAAHIERKTTDLRAGQRHMEREMLDDYRGLISVRAHKFAAEVHATHGLSSLHPAQVPVVTSYG